MFLITSHYAISYYFKYRICSISTLGAYRNDMDVAYGDEDETITHW
jgi:hypothetical protein